ERKASRSASCRGEKSEGCCSGSKAKSTGTSKEVAAHGEKSECTHAKDAAAKGDAKLAKSDDKSECPFAKAAKALAKDSKAPVTYCVAGQTFDCKVKAEQAAKTAQAAMKEVAMKYRVGDKDYCCDKMAGEACQKAG